MTTFYGKVDLRDDIIDDQSNTIYDHSAQTIGTGLVDTDAIKSQAVTTNEISDSTISTDDLAQNGASDGNVIVWDSGTSSWVTEAQSGGKTGATDGYLEPGVLTISNNSTDSDHDIDVIGGQVSVHDFNDNWKLINAPDETPAIAIDSTGEGGRINSSTLDANAWYEIAVIYDSTNDTVGYGIYKDADRPTSASELPGDFDHIREMGSPGKTWWVRTDGSSNILDFFHTSDGNMVWTQSTVSSFSDLVNATSDNGSFNTVDVSNQSPPTTTNVTINDLRLDASGNSVRVDISNESNNSGVRASQFSARALDGEAESSGSFSIFSVSNQEIFWVASNNSSNLYQFDLYRIVKFKAVN